MMIGIKTILHITLAHVCLMLTLTSSQALAQSAPITVPHDRVNCRFWKVGANSVIDSQTFEVVSGPAMVGDFEAKFLAMSFMMTNVPYKSIPVACIARGISDAFAHRDVVLHVEQRIQWLTNLYLSRQLELFEKNAVESNNIEAKAILDELVRRLPENAEFIARIKASIEASK